MSRHPQEVLVVDSDPIFKQVLVSFFRSRGYPVVSADNQALAAEKIIGDKPTIIVIDHSYCIGELIAVITSAGTAERIFILNGTDRVYRVRGLDSAKVLPKDRTTLTLLRDELHMPN